MRAEDNINADHNFHFWRHKFVLPKFIIKNSDTRSNFELLHAILKATRIRQVQLIYNICIFYTNPFQLCCLEENISHKVRIWSKKDINVKKTSGLVEDGFSYDICQICRCLYCNDKEILYLVIWNLLNMCCVVSLSMGQILCPQT